VSAETTETNENAARGSRRLITGTVTSTKMDKTVVVTVVRKFRDKRFHKFISRRVRYAAHDETNACKLGDLVELIESRPYSKTKKWRVFRTVEKAREDVQ
jgi:small subunit ribosomal protein S17